MFGLVFPVIAIPHAAYSRWKRARALHVTSSAGLVLVDTQWPAPVRAVDSRCSFHHEYR